MWKYICEIFGQKIFTQTHTSWKGKCARIPAKSDKIIFFSQLSSPQGVKFVFFFLILITKLIAKIIFASWRAWSCICMIESMFAVHRNRITLKNFYLNLSFIKLLRIRAKRCQTFLSLTRFTSKTLGGVNSFRAQMHYATLNLSLVEKRRFHNTSLNQDENFHTELIQGSIKSSWNVLCRPENVPNSISVVFHFSCIQISFFGDT